MRAAEGIGYPVVTKPLTGSHGRGLRLSLTTATEVTAGFLAANKYGWEVVVEQYIRGYDHRILVVNRTFVAAAKRATQVVVGDGGSQRGSTGTAGKQGFVSKRRA